MEARIRQLQSLLDKAVIVDGGQGTDTVVASGSVVSLRYEGDDDAERFLVGSIEERRADVAVVSPASPLGQALLGHRRATWSSTRPPGATLKVEIVDDRGLSRRRRPPLPPRGRAARRGTTVRPRGAPDRRAPPVRALLLHG